MTFRTPKEKTIQARALTNPHPRFVSLVSAGANQTPIRSIKVDIVSLEEKDMTKRVLALKADGHEIQKMVFKSGGRFDTVDAVQAFLDEGGINGTVKEADGSFVVENGDDEFTGDVREVEVSDDLTVFIGKLAGTDQDDADPDKEAATRANNSGSAITSIEVIEDTKKEDSDEAGEGGGTDDGATPEDGDEGGTGPGVGALAAGIDGSLKAAPVRKRSRTVEVKAEANPDESLVITAEKGGTGAVPSKDEDEKTSKDCGCEDEGTATRQSDGPADCGPDEVFQDGKCVKATAKVGNEIFVVLLEATDIGVDDMSVPAGSFEVTDKVEILDGDCGPGHVMISAGGRSFCVPTGDRSPVADNMEVNPSNPSGGQGSAGFGGTTPTEGQAQRADDGKETVIIKLQITAADAESFKAKIKTDAIREKFDEFSAFFSDGMTMAEVMADANDGFPPGLDMVILAAVMAMRNNFLVGDMDAVRQAGTDLGEVAAVLGGMFETVERAEDRKKVIDLLSGTFKDMPFPDEVSNKQGEDGDDAGTTPQNSSDDALASAIGELSSMMKSIADGLGEVKTNVSATKDATEVLAGRVQTLEGKRQTRKGADDGDAVDGSLAKPSPIADIRLRGALGITNMATPGSA